MQHIYVDVCISIFISHKHIYHRYHELYCNKRYSTLCCDKPIACNSGHNWHHKKEHAEFSKNKNATCAAHFQRVQPCAKWRVQKRHILITYNFVPSTVSKRTAHVTRIAFHQNCLIVLVFLLDIRHKLRIVNRGEWMTANDKI